MNKKRIGLMLAALLLMILLPLNATATDGPTSGNLGETVTWEFKDGTLTISGEGYMEGLSTSRHPEWYYLKDEITKLVVEEGILNTGSRLCKDCVNLTDVQLPSTLKFINGQSFMNCKSLIEITIPSKVTTLGYSVFEGCESLKSITLPNSVKEAEGDTFKNCKSLETVTLSTKLERVTFSMFEGCKSLKEIVLPKSVTRINSSAFRYCYNLTRVEIKGKITFVDNWAFSDCRALEKLEFPSSLEWFGDWTFYGCESLIELRFNGDMPDMFGSDVFKLLGHHDGSVCTIYYPVNNKTWSQEKMNRFSSNQYIRFEPYGTPECDHQEVTVPGKDATCTEDGLTEGKYCSVCDKVLKKQKTIDALGHDLVTTTIPPTCTEPGYDLHQCSRCEYSETNNPVEAAGHAFGEWETVKEPTVEEAGISQRTCANCTETEQREIEKLTPPPTEPPTQPEPTEPVKTEPPTTAPNATESAPTQPEPPAPQERIGAGLWIMLILVAVAGAIVAVKFLTKKKP